jgi:hypothetical protein
VALIAYEALRHREARAWIRSHRRVSFSTEEAAQAEPDRRGRRRAGRRRATTAAEEAIEE